MVNLTEMGKASKKASRVMNSLGISDKNRGLLKAADALIENEKFLISENEKDMEAGRSKGMSKGLLDRLLLSHERIEAMAEGLRQIAALDDPVGEVISMKQRPNGLLIGKKRVPIGVIGIIYESRPNVTADAFGLCFKTGNSVILKGGSDAINSNKAITVVIQNALEGENLPKDAILLVTDTDRKIATDMMKLNKYIDVLIPRGGAGLIRAVVENSTIPVIETGTGNCHIFVDESADFDKALKIIENAKTQRVGVCNACESLVIHEKIIDNFIPRLVDILKPHNVEIRGDEKICGCSDYIVPANDDDWGTEYLDYIISAKTVSDVDEAIEHINEYNTGHSEAIITNDYTNSQKFLQRVDAAAVYVNASTRFTDGGEFGFGAEIGISTQKLHARGPMGLNELTTTKYIIYGDGQIR